MREIIDSKILNSTFYPYPSFVNVKTMRAGPQISVKWHGGFWGGFSCIFDRFLGIGG
jgi:hypothetical protein